MLWSLTDLRRDKETLRRDCSCLGSRAASTGRQWPRVRLEAWIWTTAEVDPWRKTYRTVTHEQPLTLYKTQWCLSWFGISAAVDVELQKLPARMLTCIHWHSMPIFFTYFPSFCKVSLKYIQNQNQPIKGFTVHPHQNIRWENSPIKA